MHGAISLLPNPLSWGGA